jgi:hypothetical protein
MTITYLGVYSAACTPIAEVRANNQATGAVLRVLQTKPVGSIEGITRAFRLGLVKVYAHNDAGHIVVCATDSSGEDTLCASAIEAMKLLVRNEDASTWRGALEVMQTRHNGILEASSGEKFRRLKQDLDKLKSSAVENVDMLMGRSENIDVLVDRSNTLTTNSSHFKRTAVTLKKNLQWNAFKGWMTVACITIAGFLLLYYAVW